MAKQTFCATRLTVETLIQTKILPDALQPSGPENHGEIFFVKAGL
jgi:hypothetical protein